MAQWSGEPVVVVQAILNGLAMTNQCPRHGPYQINCSNTLCEQCRGQFLDLEEVDMVYTPAMVAQNLLAQLSPSKLHEPDVRRQGLGRMDPGQVDWHKLQRLPSKL